MKIKFEDYQIGLLTRLFQISPDTVRLYGKKGILRPAVKEDSNYRIFRRDDVFSMEYVMRLKQKGFSLDEIKEIISSHTLMQTCEMVQEKQKNIETEIAKLQEQKRMMEAYENSLQMIMEKEDTFEIKEPTTFLLMDIEDSIPNAVAYFKTLDSALEPYFSLYMPGNKKIGQFHVDMIDTRKRQESNLVLTCVDVNGISKKEQFPTEKISIVRASKYVYTITGIHTGLRYDTYDIMTSYLKEHGLQENGRTLIRYIASQQIYEEPVDFYEIWMPIQ